LRHLPQGAVATQDGKRMMREGRSFLRSTIANPQNATPQKTTSQDGAQKSYEIPRPTKSVMGHKVPGEEVRLEK